ncbi:alcohol dehydrogenase, partial [Globisporangium splendens]
MKLILAQQWPHVVGYDVSGVVVKCGSAAGKFAVGDEVYGMLPHNRNGALAEYASVHESYLAKKPANLSHTQAASLPMAVLTSLLAFREGNLEEGKKVLVTGGAGGVGSIAIQIAKAIFNAKHVATTASERKFDRAKAWGADEVIDYNRDAFERKLTEYDFALDCTGEAKKCIDCVAKSGSVISIIDSPTKESLQGLESKGVEFSRLIGFVLNCLSHSVTRKARHAEVNYDFYFVVGDGAVLDEIKTLCEQEAIVPVIDKVYPFEKADAALEYLAAGHATGKVVVELIAAASE